MGAYFAMAPCIACKVPFTFNPHLVPSVRVTPTSPREPVCQSCLARVNEAKRKLGEPEWVPPAGAYDVVDEGEL